MSKLIIVSNRLPATVSIKDHQLSVSQSVGGLATALGSLLKEGENLWIGWPGINSESLDEQTKNEVKEKLEKMIPVFLSEQDVELFYEGFSNTALWPLFHSFPKITFFHEEQWEGYRKVNEEFAQVIFENANEDDTIWVHDYQLLLLPGLLRAKLPKAKIAFFLHIPFPTYDIFRILPWREEVLEGLLGADLIGFHTHDDVGHFLTSVNRILGYENRLGEIKIGERLAYADAFPISIDYKKFEEAAISEKVIEEIKDYSEKFKDVKLIISIDRLDYSKGIIERLEAFELFIKEYPEYQEKVSLIMVVVPSRENVKMYDQLKTEVDTLVGNINARYRTITWSPVIYFYRSFPFESLVTLYKISPVALVSPLRDGMNLVCKEYIATRSEEDGVLILSEMAGASKELTDALIINPYNVRQVAQAMKNALEMPEAEQKRRMRSMQHIVRKNDINNWVNVQLEKLQIVTMRQMEMSMKLINAEISNQILNDFQSADKRLLLLDYDGTLVSIQKRPELAAPDEELYVLLNRLTNLPNTKVVIVSGRDKHTLDSWFSSLNIDIVAEHGVWRKKEGKDWKLAEDIYVEWKDTIRSIVNNYVERTPGSFIEEKDYSMAWHYREADDEVGYNNALELMNHLQYLTANMNLSVMEGKKVVEIKNSSVSKAYAIKYWLRDNYDFILSAGDDYTDEDMFKVLPENAYSIKIGLSPSLAKYYIKSEDESSSLEFRRLLGALVGEAVVSSQ